MRKSKNITKKLLEKDTDITIQRLKKVFATKDEFFQFKKDITNEFSKLKFEITDKFTDFKNDIKAELSQFRSDLFDKIDPVLKENVDSREDRILSALSPDRCNR